MASNSAAPGGSATADNGFMVEGVGETSNYDIKELTRKTKDIVTAPAGKKLNVQLPYVDLQKCIGCGICENKCPVPGLPAIRTIAAGESRSLKNQILL